MNLIILVYKTILNNNFKILKNSFNFLTIIKFNKLCKVIKIFDS